MRAHLAKLPSIIVVLAMLGLVWHGPIAQLENYHGFADHRSWFGIPHAADVLSNIGFLLIGGWGFLRLWPSRRDLGAAWPGYALFLAALSLTALGSGYYHMAPDNFRLIWDRVPIALACAGLLAAIRAETVPGAGKYDWAWLALAAIVSVAWWFVTEETGAGDLRPYLLLQTLPIVLVPLWQAIYRAPKRDRIAVGIAIALYVFAKIAELQDHQILEMNGFVSGHTIKHILATIAAAVLVSIPASRLRSGTTSEKHAGGQLAAGLLKN